MDRVLQNIVHPSTAAKIDGYYDAFDEMEKQFEKRVFDAGSMLMTRILSGVKDSRTSGLANFHYQCLIDIPLQRTRRNSRS